MRVAALYDVHGNLPGLEAVLGELEDVRPDLVLVGGDVVLGPFPRETLDALLALGDRARFVRGNCDRAPDEFVSGELSAEQLGFLADLPTTVSVEVDGLGSTLFCHGSPRSDEEIVTSVTPEDRLAPMLAGVEEPVVVHGHTHVRYDRAAAGKRIVCAGSVGMPYEPEPGAYWALLGPDVELRRTAYDVEEAARRIAASGHPDAAAWAREYLPAGRDPAEVSRYFEGLATRS